VRVGPLRAWHGHGTAALCAADDDEHTAGGPSSTSPPALLARDVKDYGWSGCAACTSREPMPHAPTATPQRPDADIFIPARERRALVRNGFYLAGRPATFARHRGSLVRKQTTLKRKVRSVGPRRSSAPLARCKPSRVPPIPSRARRPASRARLRHLSGQGRKPRPRPFAGWMQTVARCMRRSGRCAQGREGLRSEVWCLHTGPRT
jgi:hypothetical protein